MRKPRSAVVRASAFLLPLTVTAVALASCGHGSPATLAPAHASGPAASPSAAGWHRATARQAGTTTGSGEQAGGPLTAPAALAPFGTPGCGRPRHLAPGRPNGPRRARCLSDHPRPARRHAASRDRVDGHQPAGGPVVLRLEQPRRGAVPVHRADPPAQAATLVAAFNGGFMMPAAGGGYYTQGRTIDPLRRGAASLVIYADGSVDVGAWGSDVRMTPNVVGVRQNLVPLVAGGRPTPQAASSDWQAWGATCGAVSCASSVPGIESQWRSGLGVTADGALVYAAGRPWTRCSWRSFWCAPVPCVACSSTSTPTGPTSSLRPPGGRPGRAVQRPQAALLDRAGPVDLLRGLVGARLHHDVGPPRRLTLSGSPPYAPGDRPSAGPCGRPGRARLVHRSHAFPCYDTP